MCVIYDEVTLFHCKVFLFYTNMCGGLTLIFIGTFLHKFEQNFRFVVKINCICLVFNFSFVLHLLLRRTEFILYRF